MSTSNNIGHGTDINQTVTTGSNSSAFASLGNSPTTNVNSLSSEVKNRQKILFFFIANDLNNKKQRNYFSTYLRVSII